MAKSKVIGAEKCTLATECRRGEYLWNNSTIYQLTLCLTSWLFVKLFSLWIHGNVPFSTHFKLGVALGQ